MADYMVPQPHQGCTTTGPRRGTRALSGGLTMLRSSRSMPQPLVADDRAHCAGCDSDRALRALMVSPNITNQSITRSADAFSHADHVGGRASCSSSPCLGRNSGFRRHAADHHLDYLSFVPLLTPHAWRQRASGRALATALDSRACGCPTTLYFDHSMHVAKGVGWSSCHGDAGRDRRRRRQAAPLTMGRDCDPGSHLSMLDQIFNTRRNCSPMQVNVAGNYLWPITSRLNICRTAHDVTVNRSARSRPAWCSSSCWLAPRSR